MKVLVGRSSACARGAMDEFGYESPVPSEGGMRPEIESTLKDLARGTNSFGLISVTSLNSPSWACIRLPFVCAILQ